MKIFVTRESVRTKAVRPSGPGGHMADRRSMKIQMWALVEKLPLTEAHKKMVRKNLAHRINKKDELEVMCEAERSQEENRDTALELMNTLIADAIKVKKPRIPTEPPRNVKDEGVRQRELRYTKKKERKTSKAETRPNMGKLKNLVG
ncbi:MAG: peptide chain release factor-like protein [bacterium]|nr:hypothetical protein [Candidatus Jorgensenbacteria bacterium]